MGRPKADADLIDLLWQHVELTGSGAAGLTAESVDGGAELTADELVDGLVDRRVAAQATRAWGTTAPASIASARRLIEDARRMREAGAKQIVWIEKLREAAEELNLTSSQDPRSFERMCERLRHRAIE